MTPRVYPPPKWPCVGWGVKLYSLTLWLNFKNLSCYLQPPCCTSVCTKYFTGSVNRQTQWNIWCKLMLLGLFSIIESRAMLCHRVGLRIKYFQCWLYLQNLPNISLSNAAYEPLHTFTLSICHIMYRCIESRRSVDDLAEFLLGCIAPTAVRVRVRLRVHIKPPLNAFN